MIQNFQHENPQDDNETKEEENQFIPFNIFIKLISIDNIPNDLGITSIYLRFQLSCDNPINFITSDSIPIYNSKGRWLDNTLIKLKCLKPLEQLLLRCELFNGDTNKILGYINFPLNNQIPSPINFTLYRDRYTIIPELQWEVTLDNESVEKAGEICRKISEKNLKYNIFILDK